MKIEFKVTELTHDELVNILSTAFYGCPYMYCQIANESKKLAQMLVDNADINTESLEDVWAEVLLHGGNLTLGDSEALATDLDDAVRNAYTKGHAINVGIQQISGWGGTINVTTYDINLQSILQGCSTVEGYKYLNEVLNNDGDMYDAYNLIQIIAFGELIYG